MHDGNAESQKCIDKLKEKISDLPGIFNFIEPNFAAMKGIVDNRIVERKSKQHAICSNFDMAQCAISLDVNDALQYTINAHVNDTKELLETKKMRLMPAAFMSPFMQPRRELQRIAKYLERSFTW